MAKYCVKLDGQVLTDGVDLKTATQIATELNAENQTVYKVKTPTEAALNTYEVSLSS